MFKGSRPRIETRAQSEYSYRDREPHEKKDEALPAELEKDDHSSFFDMTSETEKQKKGPKVTKFQILVLLMKKCLYSPLYTLF